MWSVCLSIYVVYNSTYIVLTLSLLKNRESQFLPSSLLNETAVSCDDYFWRISEYTDHIDHARMPHGKTQN